MTQLRIDSYFLHPSSRRSRASTVIDVDSDAPTDDEQPAAAISTSLRRRASSTASSQRRTRKRHVLSSPLSSLPIESYFVMPQTAQRRSSSLPISMSDWQLDDEDFLPLSQLLVARSAPQPAVARPAQPVVRRALSDITNNTTNSTASTNVRLPPGSVFFSTPSHLKKKDFYYSIRAQLAHLADNTMCASCGVREHSSLHHEAEFTRAGTNIRAPSLLSPTGLAAEVERCTRADGSIGLVAVCAPCHYRAERILSRSARSASSSESSQPDWRLRYKERNKEADDAAKIARGQCECDDRCGRLVTLESAGQFEWDHLVQSFDDPDYSKVSKLISNCSSLKRCARERMKCRLLFIHCHQRHSGEQHRRGAQRRAEQRSTGALPL